MKRIGLLLIIALAAIAAPGQRTVKRDLKLYDDGGKFDFNWSELSKHKPMGEKLREFVWKHWSTKTLGRVQGVKYSIEGDPYYFHLYIEPGRSGTWQVTSVWESYCCTLYNLMEPKRKMQHRRGVVAYKVVERVQSKVDRLAQPPVTWSIVPIDVDLLADKYLLRLKRRAGEGNDLTF